MNETYDNDFKNFFKYTKEIKELPPLPKNFDTKHLQDFINEFENLQQENKEYKEVIDKINKKINDFIKCCKAEKIESGSDFLHHSYWNMFENFNKQIKEILKEVK